MVPPTYATRVSFALMAFIIVASATYLIVQYPSLPWLLTVRFQADGAPNGWQYRTPARVMMPVLVQLALSFTFGGIGFVLLSRWHKACDTNAPDVKAAAVAAEAVTLIALIWVAFQGYAAWALVHMWTVERAGLGWYTIFALFVPTRDGSRWTLNFGRPKAAALLAIILLIGIVGPMVILVFALR